MSRADRPNPTLPAAGPERSATSADAARGGLRVLVSGACQPAWNLAFDAALLESDGPPTLRLYSWTPTGVSIGRFQDPASFADQDASVVRRCTGGGAIRHQDELTFALTGDLDLLPGDVDASYALVHDAVARALARVGVRARRLAASEASAPRHRADGWCFAAPSRHDLVAPDGRKLVGSAQRRVLRPRPRILHHGSIPLRGVLGQPFVAAVTDQIDAPRARGTLESALIAELAAALGRSPAVGRPSAQELAVTRERLSRAEPALA